MTTLHPLQRRYFVEDLFRLRRSDEQRRYLASQRSARIDPNPHQIDAVVFALSRIEEGGCILADEVGLGKTIEAGLVISQLLAERARRVLLITPKPLLGQWKQELYTLFGLEAQEGSATAGAFAGEGVFLAGRELVGSEKGLALLLQNERFDLCVIDEAHEIFSGIYKRFDAFGNYQDDSPNATIAGRVRSLLQAHATPVLLLTATPIQNSLTELWGLLQFIDPNSTLLGSLLTFRRMFCDGDDRHLVPEQEYELRGRLNSVVKRTLRRQAQEFIERPFVGRHAEVFEYAMTPEERRLYDDVSAYLLEPNLCAFRGSQRQLLLLGFHKRMASSMRALAASLEVVAARLRGEGNAEAMSTDLEDDELGEEGCDEGPPPLPAAVQAELARVEGLAARARALPHDTKARTLIDILRSRVADKMVIFTESLTTQDYLVEILVQSGLLSEAEITVFRGVNDSPRAAEALERWHSEVPGPSPSRDIAVRLALVHEFATRSRVFISTEAGAKGLNLQFCSTLINYDLPWNPQRIEQRIGRCHRYGQKNGVTVINFLDRENEAQKLTLEILSEKLELFGSVLGASDQVLKSPDLAGAMGADFETRLRRIYAQARSRDEIEQDLRRLREEMGHKREQLEAAQARTAGIIQSRFDDSVQQVLRRIQADLKPGLAELDRDLARVAQGDHLHIKHPAVLAAADEARALTTGRSFRVAVAGTGSGRAGRLLLARVAYAGFEPTERLLTVVLLEGDTEPLEPSVAEAIWHQPMEDCEGLTVSVPDEELEDALEDLVFQDQARMAAREEQRFEQTLHRIERYVEDRLLLLRRERTSLDARLTDARDEFSRSVGADQRTRIEARQLKLGKELEKTEAEIAQLQSRDDAVYQKLRSEAFERRYVPPRVERVLEAEVKIR